MVNVVRYLGMIVPGCLSFTIGLTKVLSQTVLMRVPQSLLQFVRRTPQLDRIELNSFRPFFGRLYLLDTHCYLDLPSKLCVITYQNNRFATLWQKNRCFFIYATTLTIELVRIDWLDLISTCILRCSYLFIFYFFYFFLKARVPRLRRNELTKNHCKLRRMDCLINLSAFEFCLS